MNNLQIFENREFGRLNVINQDGKIYVDGIDTCTMLGYSNPRDAILRHCEIEGVVFHDTRVSTGKRRDGSEATKYIKRKYISEGNLYRLIFKSKLPSAKSFECWVCDEVLPRVRKSGVYMTDDIIEKTLNNPDLIIQMATKLKQERHEKIEEAKRAENLKKVMIQDEPYTSFAKQIEVSDGSISIGQFAKLLVNNNINIGRNRLFSLLRDKGYLIKSGKEKNMPKQEYIEQGLFRICERIINTSEGEVVSTTTLMTGKGQIYFAKRIFDMLDDDCVEIF